MWVLLVLVCIFDHFKTRFLISHRFESTTLINVLCITMILFCIITKSVNYRGRRFRYVICFRDDGNPCAFVYDLVPIIIINRDIVNNTKVLLGLCSNPTATTHLPYFSCTTERYCLYVVVLFENSCTWLVRTIFTCSVTHNMQL